MTHHIPCFDYYNILAEFPIPKKIIYGIPGDMRPYRYIGNASIHDVIFYNLHSLVPNVDMARHLKNDFNEIQNWIDVSRSYGEQLLQQYYQNILLQERKLSYIMHQQQSCEKLIMRNVDKLPYDLIRYIRGFLLPETRILYYTNKYNNIGDLVKKMPNDSLKRFYREVIRKNYFESSPYCKYNTYRNYAPCIPHDFTIQLNPPNKTAYSECINRLIHALRNTPPITPESYMFFQTRALKLIQTIVYITQYRKPWLSKKRQI